MNKKFNLSMAPEFETYTERNKRIIREARAELKAPVDDRFPPVAFALAASLCAATAFMGALLFA